MLIKCSLVSFNCIFHFTEQINDENDDDVTMACHKGT